MNEKALRMYAELTQEVSLCQDEDFKNLGKGILELAKNYDNALQENEKLKSIIKEAIEYITSEETIETFRTIESREKWVKINHKLLEILDKGE